MAQSQKSTKFCLLCYKAIEPLNQTTKTKDTINKFLKILKRFVEQKENSQCDLFNDSKLVECCIKCNVIIEGFCESYNQLKILELKLDFMLDNLVEKILYANRIPGRWVHVNNVLEETFQTDLEMKAESEAKIRRFRQTVIKAGHQRKIGSQPTVLLNRIRNVTQTIKISSSNATIELSNFQKIARDHTETTSSNGDSDKLNVCTICGDKFKLLKSLNIHLRIHRDKTNGKWCCPLCQKLVSTKQALDNHLKSHKVSPETKLKSFNQQQHNFSSFTKDMSANIDNIESTTFPDNDTGIDYDDIPELEDCSGADFFEEADTSFENEFIHLDNMITIEGTANFEDPQIEVKLEHQPVVGDGCLESIAENISTTIKATNVIQEERKKSSNEIEKQQSRRYSLRGNRVRKFVNEMESDDNDDKNVEYNSADSSSNTSAPATDDEIKLKRNIKPDTLKPKRGRPKSNNPTLRSYKSRVSPKLDVECKICSKKFNSLLRKDHHFKYCHDLTRSKTGRFYPCKKDKCSAYFLTSRQVRKHRMFDHGKMTLKEKTEEKGKRLKCLKCEKRFYIKSELDKHLESHKDPSEWTFECEICAKKFAIKYKLKMHMTRHKNIKPYKCRFCEKGFLKCWKLNKHLVEEHKDEDFNTGEAANQKIIEDGEVKSVSTADRSSVDRKGRQPLILECEICKRKFTGFMTKKLHFKACHDLSKLEDESKVEKCNAIGCTAYFLKKSQLRYHSWYTHGMGELHKREKNFKCEQCGKGFINRYHLKVHLEYHKDPSEWKFDCETCGRKCANEGKLRNHVRTHTKERPFQCPFCVEMFGTSSNLKNHLNKWHRDEAEIRAELDGKKKHAEEENAKIKVVKGKNINVKKEEVEKRSGEFQKWNKAGTNVLTKKGDCFGDGTLVEFEDLD